jgi:hypothetical protein
MRIIRCSIHILMRIALHVISNSGTCLESKPHELVSIDAEGDAHNMV